MKNKVIKALVSVVVLVAILAFGIGLTGCSDLPIVVGTYSGDGDGTYKVLQPIMNAGETITVNKDSFKGLDSYYNAWGMDNIDRFELWTYDLEDPRAGTREGVVTINDNVITAANSGYTTVLASLYRNGKWQGKNVTFKLDVHVAEIYVINEATMTHITTAQGLADMKDDLLGHYILKADIDLADFGEWEAVGKGYHYSTVGEWETAWHEMETHRYPIANGPFGFVGMLVNPYGYKIKNLTIATSEKGDGGLFGDLGDFALISGVILENTSIDMSDYNKSDPTLGFPALDPIGSPNVGGIAAHGGGTAKILNCSVSGTIIGGGESTGGILGSNSNTLITGCSFTGTIKNHKAIPSQIFAIGGIVGFGIGFGVINCTVIADIDGGTYASAGGIIGSTHSLIEAVISSFTGTLAGLHTGTMVGYNKFSDAPINFN